MFTFDEQVVAWRKGMTAHGIGPGALRDELECHLRDGYDSRVRAGMDPATAFAEAAAILGTPKALRQEYNAALTRWTRAKHFFGRRVELLPTQMRLCAWAAIPAGLCNAYALVSALLGMKITEVNPSPHIMGVPRKLFWFFVCVMLANLAGPLNSVRYLYRPAYAPARNLAWFWICTVWVYSVILLMFVSGLSNGRYDPNGGLLPDLLETWQVALTLAVALVVFLDWEKRLRMAFSRKPTRC